MTWLFLFSIEIISFSGCTRVYISIYLPKDIWLLPGFGSYEQSCRFLCGHMFSPPLGKYQGVRLLDYKIIVSYNTLIQFGVRNHQTVLRWLYHFSFPPVTESSIALHPHQRLVLAMFQILAILIGVYWYLVVLISYVYLLSVYPLWWGAMMKSLLFWVGLFVLLSFKRYSCILDNSPLSYVISVF